MNQETFRLLKNGLEALFPRHKGKAWTYPKEYFLVTIAAGENPLQELADLSKYKRDNPAYFPGSLSALLAAWEDTLDNMDKFYEVRAATRAAEPGSGCDRSRSAEDRLRDTLG